MLIGLSTHGDPYSKAQVRFEPHKVSGLMDLVEIASRMAISISTFRGDYRKLSNFQQCQLIALDFDAGWTIKEATTFFDRLGKQYAIATSQSHQKQKGSMPPCDRFRVFLPMDRPTDNHDIVKFNLKQWSAKTPADRACSDATRFFKPSPCIIVARDVWPMGTWEKLPKDYQTDAELLDKMRQDLARYRASGTLPPQLVSKIMLGAPEGQRNITAYRIACQLAMLGIPSDRALVILLSGALNSLGPRELGHVVLNAYRRVIEEKLKPSHGARA